MSEKLPSQERDPALTHSTDPVAALGGLIGNLAHEFAGHPGFMWTESGFEVLHADWPAYPRGHGIASCLHSFSEYPRDTRFFPIDNIDHCTLFAVGEKPKQDPYGSQHLHVAVWDKDLLECESSGYIEGVRAEEEFLSYPNGSLNMTPKGINAVVIDLLLGPASRILENRILDFLRDAQYDTAVREASILVEMQLRRLSGLPDHGRRLVDKCFGEAGILVPRGITNADRLLALNAFSSYFKYVRNEYAHTLAKIDMLTATTIVRRSAVLLTVIQTIERRLGTGNSGQSPTS
jgi:hypothetical protein